MEAVIMAGGKGTRVAGIAPSVPKPMLKLAGKPVLEHQIACLRRQGVNEITIVTGHLGGVIKNHFGGSVKYIEETSPLGTAGALWYFKDAIKDDFLLINGDVVFDIDIRRFALAHRENGGVATLFTHPNDHPYDSVIVVSNEKKQVANWLTKEDKRGWYKNRVNAGLHMFSPKIFERFGELKKVDLDRDILRPMVGSGELCVYDSPEYVKDMGTPERLAQAENDILSGKVRNKCLDRPQKAYFFDRDGTINKHAGFLRDIDDFELIGPTVGLIKKANREGCLAIVVTNQPVIARGELSWQQLDEIHNKMETQLGERGAYVDDIFVCPHHPDKGFEGERAEYKIDCDCRKPKPGLILQAAEKYNIDLPVSVMVGDSESDKLAAKAASVGKFICLANYTRER